MRSKLTRRHFLGIAGSSAVLLPAFATLPNPTAKGTTTKSPVLNAKAILFDGNRCIGCRLCMGACNLKYKLPREEKENPGPYALSSKTWITVRPYVASEATFARYSCQHCVDPACASVCPVGAITKHEEGPVVLDTDRCFGCKYCIIACPFKVPKFDEEKRTATKCTMCHDRVLIGQVPACVDACPTGALSFGDRSVTIERAKSRADKTGAYIYGLEEAGGTSVILLLRNPPSKFGLSDVQEHFYTSPAVLSRMLVARGGLAIFGSATLAFLAFIIWRREAIRRKIKEIPR